MNRSHLGRDYRRVWYASAASSLGTSVSGVVIPLIAVELFSASPFKVSVLIAAETVPWLIFGLLAGVWVDRLSKRSLLAWSGLVRFLLFASVPLIWLAEHLSYVYLLIVVFLAGILSVFTTVSSMAILPSVVERPQLVAANSRLAAATTAASVGGEGLAGVLYQWLGGPVTFVVEAITSLIGGLAARSISTPARSIENSPHSFAKQLREGFRITLRDQRFRSITIAATIQNFGEAARYALVPVFLLTVLSVEPSLFGLLVAAAGVGGLVGAALAEPMSKWLGSGRAWRVSLVGLAIPGALIPLADTGWRLALFPIGYFTTSLLAAVGAVVTGSARQAMCPPELIGRLSATSRTLTWGSIPLGALFGGTIGTVLGTRTAFWSLLALPLLAWVVVKVGPLGDVRDLTDTGQPETAAPTSPVPSAG